MTSILTPKQLDFLRILAQTGFITNKHLAQLDFAKASNSNHHLTKRLLDGGYIGRIIVVNSFGMGRKVMYFLATKGAKFLAQLDNIPLEEIVYTNTKGGIKTAKDGGEFSLVRADFFHKEAYICAFLAFTQYLQKTNYFIDDSRHYYQLAGNKGTALPIKKRNFRPDGIWFFKSISANEPNFIYVVEVHRHSDRKHIIKQLRQHLEAIKEKSLQTYFGVEQPYFVLSIFADNNTAIMRSVLDELQQTPDWVYLEKLFMFARLEDLIADFYAGLGYFGGIKKPIPKDLTRV